MLHGCLVSTYFSNFPRNSISPSRSLIKTTINGKSLQFPQNEKKANINSVKRRQITKAACESLWNPFSTWPIRDNGQTCNIDFGPFSPPCRNVSSEHIRFAHMLPVTLFCSTLQASLAGCEGKLFSFLHLSRYLTSQLVGKWNENIFQVLFLTVFFLPAWCSLWLSKLINFS